MSLHQHKVAVCFMYDLTFLFYHCTEVIVTLYNTPIHRLCGQFSCYLHCMLTEYCFKICYLFYVKIKYIIYVTIHKKGVSLFFITFHITVDDVHDCYFISQPWVQWGYGHLLHVSSTICLSPSPQHLNESTPSVQFKINPFC